MYSLPSVPSIIPLNHCTTPTRNDNNSAAVLDSQPRPSRPEEWRHQPLQGANVHYHLQFSIFSIFPILIHNYFTVSSYHSVDVISLLVITI